MVRRVQGDGLDSNAWMVTFSDLLNLLLTFFVMLVAISSMDKGRLIKAFSAFAAGPPGMLEGEAPAEQSLITDQNRELRQEILKTILTLGKTSLAGEAEAPKDLAGLVEVLVDPRGVVIRFSERLLFESGASDPKLGAKKLIQSIAPMLGRLKMPIEVEGHTDNTPIKTARFGSNWELSIDRAVKIVRLLEQYGVEPKLLSASGYADLVPIADDKTAEGRAKNRRVEIVIKLSEGDKNG